ncbi:MAG: hypothetical protein KY395_00285 [Actinobacteria bacterium]|nr:hypothetical protein [Actinomycetota bacterium]
MSVLGQPGQPHLLVSEPEDGLRRAMSLPAEDDCGVGDVSDEEGQVFYEALVECRAADPAHKDGR